MVRRLLGVVVAASFCASNAFAVGVDLTTVACPGTANSRGFTGDLNCAGGQDFQLIITFQPAEAISDLVAGDVILDIATTNDVGSTGNFWDWQTANPEAMSIARTIAAVSCQGYKTDLWSGVGSGDAWASLVRGPTQLRVAATVYRPTPVAVAFNQKLFYASFMIHTAVSAEAGGELQGCCESQTMLVLQQLVLASASSQPTTTLASGGQIANYMQLYPTGNCAGPVPAARQSWGRLKSLYR